MARGKKSTFQRRFLIASAVFGLFVLANFALFGWLIYRSLSEQKIREVLLEAQDQAESLAHQIAERSRRQGDLYTAIASQRETQTYIDSVLAKREIIRDVTIYDRKHVLVYQQHGTLSVPVGEANGSPTVGSPEAPPQRVEQRTEQVDSGPILVPGPRVTAGDDLQVRPITVPIADLGTLEIGISPVELNKRITVLRSTLIQESAITGIASFVLLLTSFVFVWLLLRRSQRLEAQAAEAERMAYVGTLASGLAHEIRSPLNSLSLNMQMLEEEMSEIPASSTSGRRLLNITRSELSRLERLATDFLTYAKPRSLDLQEIPAVRLFERLRDVLAGETRQRGLQLVVNDRSNGARVKVDPEQFNQLLLNLAQNAIAATEGSGRSPSLFLTVVRQGDKVTLEVVDNGVGMAEEEQKKIFDLFYSNRKGGTGLGLAIVDRIARAHGAELNLRSAPGVGTAVSITLPLASSDTSSRGNPLPKLAAT